MDRRYAEYEFFLTREAEEGTPNAQYSRQQMRERNESCHVNECSTCDQKCTVRSPQLHTRCAGLTTVWLFSGGVGEHHEGGAGLRVWQHRWPAYVHGHVGRGAADERDARRDPQDGLHRGAGESVGGERFPRAHAAPCLTLRFLRF